MSRRPPLIYTTPGTYPIIIPAGLRRVRIFACGGGGGGGGAQSGWGSLYWDRRASGGCGGGAALPFWYELAVVPGEEYTLVLGAGGTAGVGGAQNMIATGTAGGSGVDTAFWLDATVLARFQGASGGDGGKYSTPSRAGMSNKLKKWRPFIDGAAYYIPTAPHGTGGLGGWWGNNTTPLWYASVTADACGPNPFPGGPYTQGAQGDSFSDLGDGTKLGGHGGGAGCASNIKDSVGGAGGNGGSGNSAGAATAGSPGSPGTLGGGGGGGGAGGSSTSGGVTAGAGGAGAVGGNGYAEVYLG